MPTDASRACPRGRVVIVDDDALFRESLERNLGDAGFRVVGFEGGEEALVDIAGAKPTDLVILDWRMPGITGIEVLRRLRACAPDLPVIFLTALSDQIYEEAALIGGAVDFVEKTRSFTILLRRIELAIGAAREAAPVNGGTAVERIGPLALAHETARASWNGTQVDLTFGEYNIVRYLAERAGQDVRYRELYDLVRGKGFIAGAGADGYRANVRTFIKRIRQKFRDMDPAFDRIENYPGFGYRWRQDDADPTA